MTLRGDQFFRYAGNTVRVGAATSAEPAVTLIEHSIHDID